MLFEACEKKLEVTVKPSFIGKTSGLSLRDFDSAIWTRIVEKSKAKILSKISNDHLTCYLLSESSLFVWDDRFTMITCGETTLIDGAKEFFKHYPIEATRAVIFERKNEFYPEKQKTCFKKDVDKLQNLFKGNVLSLGQTDSRFVGIYSLDKKLEIDSKDNTLEVLMYDINPDVLSLFTDSSGLSQKDSKLNKESIRELFNFNNLLVNYQWDDYFFEPFGYSLNAIKDNFYFTVHVTPQNEGSYISFETNAQEDFNKLIGNLTLNIKPKKFDVIHFSKNNSINVKPKNYNNELYINKKIPCGYEVDYYQFVEEN